MRHRPREAGTTGRRPQEPTRDPLLSPPPAGMTGRRPREAATAGFGRMARGLAALLVLLALIVGTPFLLLQIGRLPELGAFPAILLAPDNGRVLVWLLTVLGWLAWAAFTASVFLELVALVRGRRWRFQLPGLSGPRGPAALLLVPILGMLPLSAAHAEPSAPVTQRADQQATTLGELPVETAGYRYTVQRGDDLWTLAERFYGDGLAWPHIAAANSIITSPDQLDIGWELILPRVPDLPQVEAIQKPALAEDQPEPEAQAESRARAESEDSAESVGEAESAEPVEAGNQPVSGRQPGPAPAPSPWARPAPVPPASSGVAPEAQSPADSAARDAAPTDAAPTDAAPADAGPTDAAPTDAAPTDAGSDAQSAAPESTPAERIAYATAGVSSLIAAALLTTLALQREAQLSARSPGRRIMHPGPAGQALEAALGQAQDPVSLRTLDLALRALGRHQRESGTPLPALREVLVDDAGILLAVDRVPDRLPPGFRLEGSSLRIGAEGQELLGAQAGSLRGAPSPYPGLVCLGENPRGALQLHDLETAGSLAVAGPEDLVQGVLRSLLLELSCSWWGQGQSVTVVQGDAELATALDDPTVRTSDDLDEVLAELTGELAQRHPLRTEAHPRDLRTRPELEDAWRTRILLLGKPPTPEQRVRLDELIQNRRVVVVAADPELSGPCLTVTRELSRLTGGRPFRAQAMTQQSRDHLVELLRATASSETTEAPWWTVSAAARRAASNLEEPAMDAEEPVLPELTAGQPTVLLVGPVDLMAARGERPARAARQCLEYAAWLLEHPGATAPMMSTALYVAEGTRRSNMSRLRSWLGSADDGDRFLPEAYSGRIQLHAGVTSDWNEMQLLTVGGANRASDDNLRAVLELVRGAPLADAAPGQWHWAEELRTDISSLVRDVGLVLGDRALDRGDLDLARWAVTRALVAAPADERLLAARVRTEQRAGNCDEVERLALHLVRNARTLNIDLSDDTVALLQEALEGRPRVRLG